VLLNLLGNAIKFTHEGDVSLHVSVADAEARPVRLLFSVTDSGIGVPADKLASIFNPFEQADGSTTRKFGGTGLGLSISTKLVHLMDGEIGVESDPGQGSRFWFTLPADVVEAAEVPFTRLLDQVRVLIADDRAKSRTALSAIVERLGATVHGVSSGDEAISELAMSKGGPFDLLLVDARMPGSDGFEVARCARRLPNPPRTVMMLGAVDLHLDAEECRRLGIQQYVVKPVRESELATALHRALNGFGQELLTAAPEPQVKIPALTVLLAEDNAVNQRLATRLLEKMGHSVTLAANGEQAARAHAMREFDLILMDVQMPEVNGFEATARIREREKITGAHIPIIALTAHAIQGDRERCLAAGMDDYLSKPLNASALFEKLKGVSAARIPAVL
jgi:CheY-like chemotaxis protein